MMANMKPVRLPEGGRAALSFPFQGDWEKTQRAAFYGASRANILKNWNDFPEWLRRDKGFQCLMDCYCPVDDETFLMRNKLREEQQVELVKNLLGTRRFDPKRSGPVTDEEVLEILNLVPGHRACVDYGVTFGGSTALLTNSTTRTVVGLKCPANQANRIWGFDIGFDGTTSTNGPAICELDTNTWATNAPGTNSTSVTPNPNDSVRTETVQSTAAKAWTTEPTALSPVELFFVPNYMGSAIVFTPLTKPFGAKGGNGCSMRVTQQSGITGNTTGALKSEE